jgi:hypothetical protein
MELSTKAMSLIGLQNILKSFINTPSISTQEFL